MLTKAQLLAKKESLAAQLEQVKASFHALTGAIQCCDELLALCETEEVESLGERPPA